MFIGQQLPLFWGIFTNQSGLPLEKKARNRSKTLKHVLPQQLPGGKECRPCNGSLVKQLVRQCTRSSCAILLETIHYAQALLLPAFKQFLRKASMLPKDLISLEWCSVWMRNFDGVTRNRRLHSQTDNAGTDKPICSIQISNIGIPWRLLNIHQTELY